LYVPWEKIEDRNPDPWGNDQWYFEVNKWLMHTGVRHVEMESSRLYWKPIY